MKDVVLDEAVSTKFNLYFSYLYFIFYEFSNFMNGYKSSTVTHLLYRSYEAAGVNWFPGRWKRGKRWLGLWLPVGKQSSGNGCGSNFVPGRDNGTWAVLVGTNGGDARLRRCGRVCSETRDCRDGSSDSRLRGSSRKAAALMAKARRGRRTTSSLPGRKAMARAMTSAMAAGAAAFSSVETTGERTVLRGVCAGHGRRVQGDGWHVGPGVMRTARQVGPTRQLFSK
jgi:hypothetical protein